MPGRGGVSLTKLSNTGSIVGMPGSPTASDFQQSGDWLAWQRVEDPLGGAGRGADMNITYSALAKYLGTKIRVHNTPQEANTVAAKLDELYRCPSDNLPARPAIASDKPINRYSYSMNILYTNPIFTISGFGRGQRFGSTFTGKITSIRGASERVLLVCEDETTIDDGTFSPNAANWMAGKSVNAVAARHENKFKKAASLANPGKTEQARGNVGFADGHGEFMSRKEAISQRYSGNPTPDPVGF